MKRILVTGGAGFIGSHLTHRLLSRGMEVWCLDNFNDYYSPAIKEANVRDLLQNPCFHLVRGDILDKALLEGLGREPFDAIVHLAARAGVRPSIRQPGLYVDVNVHGTLQMLELARTAKVKKFVFASSSSVYGVNAAPFRETDPVLSPISPYAATKIAGEGLCRVYASLYDIATVCLRFFTVYGPAQRPEMAIHKFTRCIDTGAPIDLFGNGHSSRDYTYIDDIVAGIERSLDLACGYEIVNLGNSHPVELGLLIRKIEALLGRQAVIRPAEDQAGDVPVTFASIDKAARLLGYEPRVNLDEGLQRFVWWYQKTARPKA